MEMCKIPLLAIVSACCAMAGSIQIGVSATAVGPTVDYIWTELTWENQPMSSAVAPRGERWDNWSISDAQIGFGITFPPIALPEGAEVLFEQLTWYSESTVFIPLTKTVSVSPVLADCGGEPCPYSPADFDAYEETFVCMTGGCDFSGYPSGGAAMATYTVTELRTGAEADGYWMPWVKGFGDLGPFMKTPGFNAVTTVRWTLTRVPNVNAQLMVEYQVADTPEPSTGSLFLGGLLTVIAVPPFRRRCFSRH